MSKVSCMLEFELCSSSFFFKHTKFLEADNINKTTTGKETIF